jgi:hypothetical protein
MESFFLWGKYNSLLMYSFEHGTYNLQKLQNEDYFMIILYS